jgi:hypothetical protein
MKIVNPPALTAAGLASFITADPLAQRRTLQEFKYPEPEGDGRAMYYREATAGIRSALQSRSPEVMLRTRALDLERSVGPGEQISGRIANNVRALRSFADIVSSRTFVLQAGRHLAHVHSGVTIRATPELFVVENGTLKLIKLLFREQVPTVLAANAVRKTIWMAGRDAGLSLAPSQVLYLHVQTGRALGTNAPHRRLEQVIDAACDSVAAIWPTLPAPGRLGAQGRAAGGP